jgi:ABC-type multidrug transport system ATPase subunit
VRESLAAVARLRLPVRLDARTRTRTLIVEPAVHELGRHKEVDRLLGGAQGKGIAGGERRRLSLGCVLVARPAMIVLAVRPTMVYAWVYSAYTPLFNYLYMIQQAMLGL